MNDNFRPEAYFPGEAEKVERIKKMSSASSYSESASKLKQDAEKWAKTPVYYKTFVRIMLPNSYLIQAMFLCDESIQKVYDFINSVFLVLIE